MQTDRARAHRLSPHAASESFHSTYASRCHRELDNPSARSRCPLRDRSEKPIVATLRWWKSCSHPSIGSIHAARANLLLWTRWRGTARYSAHNVGVIAARTRAAVCDAGVAAYEHLANARLITGRCRIRAGAAPRNFLKGECPRLQRQRVRSPARLKTPRPRVRPERGGGWCVIQSAVFSLPFRHAST
jgi:hypothetical protein